jgi:hypothetical protein
MSDISLSDELDLNLNDSVEFIRNSELSQKEEPKRNSDLTTDLSLEEKTASTLSRKFYLFN